MVRIDDRQIGFENGFRHGSHSLHQPALAAGAWG